MDTRREVSGPVAKAGPCPHRRVNGVGMAAFGYRVGLITLRGCRMSGSGPGCVKTRRGTATPGILSPVVMRRTEKRKKSSSARHCDQIRFRFHTAWVKSVRSVRLASAAGVPNDRPRRTGQGGESSGPRPCDTAWAKSRHAKKGTNDVMGPARNIGGRALT
jgi:hypothetical protein